MIWVELVDDPRVDRVIEVVKVDLTRDILQGLLIRVECSIMARLAIDHSYGCIWSHQARGFAELPLVVACH